MKPIYKPEGRAKEYCGLALNIYTGCTHGCTYCYAAKNAKRWGRDFSQCVPRYGIVEQTRAQLSRGTIKGQLIQLCFTCDPYPNGVDTLATRQIIEAIKDSGNHVQILTKNGSAVRRDFDLLDSGDWFGVTLTSGGAEWTAVHEPGADAPLARLAALSEAKQAGIHTWASFEPVYFPEYVYGCIQSAGGFIDTYRIGKLNHYASSLDWAAFGWEAEKLCREYGRDYYLKRDLREIMERERL